MIALIQRVTQAKVDVNGETIGQIGKGLLVLLGVEKEDNQEKADKLAEKVLNYRICQAMNEYVLASCGVHFSVVRFQFVNFRYFCEILRFSLLILQLLIEVIG